MLCTGAVPCYAARSAILLTSLTAGSTMVSAWKTARGVSRRAATLSSPPWIGGWTQGTSSASHQTISRERCSTPPTPPSISSVSFSFLALLTWMKFDSWQGFIMATKACIRFLDQKRQEKKSHSIRWLVLWAEGMFPPCCLVLCGFPLSLSPKETGYMRHHACVTCCSDLFFFFFFRFPSFCKSFFHIVSKSLLFGNYSLV